MTAKLWRRFVVLLLLSLAVIAFGWYGGDVPEDRILNAAGQETETDGITSHGPGPFAVTDVESAVPVPAAPYIAPVLGLQRYEDCPRRSNGQWLRFQIAHKPDSWPVRVECVYGLVKEE